MLLFDFEYLRAQRRKRGLSQSDWGKLLGVTGATVGKWERGEISPSVDNLLKIVTVYGDNDIRAYFMEKFEKP